MNFRLFGIVLLCLPGIGFATLPVAGGLDVPTSTSETLSPVDGDDLVSLREEYEEVMPAAPEVTIYWRPGWDSPRLVTIYRDAQGGYNVGVETRQEDGTHRRLDSAGLESELADRIVRLILFELGRSKKHDRVPAVDVAIYYFSAAGSPGKAGQTHRFNHATTVNRLCDVVDALSGLPGMMGSDRTYVLGVIDRGVTAIEVAYKQATLLPP